VITREAVTMPFFLHGKYLPIVLWYYGWKWWKHPRKGFSALWAKRHR